MEDMRRMSSAAEDMSTRSVMENMSYLFEV